MIEDDGTRDGDLLLILSFLTKVLSKLKSVEARGEVKTQKIASMRILLLTNMSMLQKYTFIRVLGDGTFGVVSLAKEKETGNMVAIKKMKQDFRSWDECLKLKEVQALQRLKHVNIIKAIEIFRDNNTLYFVFEYMKQNLYELVKTRSGNLFPEHVVRNISYQIVQAVSYMHRLGLFHRDLKPENILCQGPELIKLADFGQAREIRSRPPYTDYISTRWYRAPEVQLGSTHYNSPIDIWAIACIMSEVYTTRPLFPGSGTIDQVYKICGVLGTPTKATWSEGVSLAVAMSIRLPVMVPTPLSTLVPMASEDGIGIMKEMLQWDPRKRPTAGQVLRHKYFQVNHPFHSSTHSVSTAGHSTKNTLTSTPIRERGGGGGKGWQEERGGGGKGWQEERGGGGKGWQEEKGGRRSGQMGAGLYERNDIRKRREQDIAGRLKKEREELSRLEYESKKNTTQSIRESIHHNNNSTNLPELQHQRKQWQYVQRGTTESQDSGVDSELAQHSNHSTSYPRSKAQPLESSTMPIGSLAPPIGSLAPPNKSSGMPLISSLFGRQKRVVKRKETLPSIDSLLVPGEETSRRSQWVTTETTGGRRDEGFDKFPIGRKLKGEEGALPWELSRVPPNVVDRREAVTFYSKARYSPVVSGGRGNKLGFGSSAPRFHGDATPSPQQSGKMRDHYGRNIFPLGGGGGGRGGGQWNEGGLFSSDVRRGGGGGDSLFGNNRGRPGGGEGGGGGSSNLPNLGLLARMDWTSRYKR